MKRCLCLIALLLAACGKEVASVTEPPVVPPVKPKTAAVPLPVVPVKKLPPVPQGKLPQMDPEKAKFIAAPSTPKDPEVKKGDVPAGKSVTEVKKVGQSAPETKKAEVPVIEVKAAEQAVPEVKKATPAGKP